jgi:hypothetical protein
MKDRHNKNISHQINMIIIRKKHFDNNMKVHNSKHGLKHKGDKEGNNKQCTY